MLRRVAEAFGPLRQDVVFVGGTAVGLLISDKAADAPRPTLDVDVIANVSSLAEYQTSMRGRLLAAGLRESTEPGDPICSWRLGSIRVDVMPVDPTVLGFTNVWYRGALKSAVRVDMDGVEILVIDAPHFVGTKLEAFRGRGKRDCYASHDLEDIIALVDGRAELAKELAAAEIGLRDYVAGEFLGLLANPDFRNALPGHLSDEGRVNVVLRRWASIAAIGQETAGHF